MAMLGDLLADARRSAGDFETWLRAAELALAEQAAGAAEREGLGVAGYARMAVADFARFASEEDWATLVSNIRDAQDPGRACLLAMVYWRLTASGCAVHSHQAHASDQRRAAP
jgi:hypothetical protein